MSINITSSYTSQTTSPPTLGNKQAKPSADKNAVEEFLAYQKKTPQEKIRESILQKLGLTEDSLKNMSTDARKKIEDEIKVEIEKMIKGNLAQKGILLDISV